MKRRLLVLTTACVLAFSATVFADGEVNHGTYKECEPATSNFDGELNHGNFQECEDGEVGHGTLWENFLKFFVD